MIAEHQTSPHSFLIRTAWHFLCQINDLAIYHEYKQLGTESANSGIIIDYTGTVIDAGKEWI